MKNSASLNRRTFLQLMGSTTALGAVGASVPWLKAATIQGLHSGFAYVSCGEGAEQGILTFAIRSGRWTHIQFISSRRPTYMTLHPALPVLYTINEIDLHENLPTGTVEAYSVASNGHLTLLNRTPLSLAATLPSHMAVSPDGKSLVVASHGGGIYNVLPIAANGSLGRAHSIVKETGSGPDEEHQRAAHPQHTLFHADGKFLLTSDLGSDSLNVFALENGRLRKVSQTAVNPGSGPSGIAVHPSGLFIFVANKLDGSLSGHRFDIASGELSRPFQSVPLQKNAGALALHPSGRFLYAAADRVSAWQVDSVSGVLAPIASPFTVPAANTISLSADGSLLYLLDKETNNISGAAVASESGQLDQPVLLAKAPKPRNLVVKSI